MTVSRNPVSDHFATAHRWLFTRPRGHLPLLTGVRALAILGVLGLHLVWPLTIHLGRPALVELIMGFPPLGLVMQGHFGVDAFFVLSGFLIASVYFRDYEAHRGGSRSGLVRSFFVKRALRLLPVYYSVLLFTYLWAPEHCPSVWSNVLYVNNYFPMQEVCIFWSWSLAIEEQFYVLFPPLCAALYVAHRRGHGNRVFLAAFGLACLTNVVYMATADPFTSDWDFGRRFYQPSQFRAGSLLLGVYAAYLQRHHEVLLRAIMSRRGIRRAVLLTSALLIAIPVAVPTNSMLLKFDEYTIFGLIYEALYHYIFSLGIALVLVVLLNEPAKSWLNRALSRPVFHPIARLSYAMYVIHPIVILAVYEQLWAGLESLTIIIPLAVLLSTLAAYVIFVLIEVPSLRARDWLMRRRESDPPLS